MTVGELIEKLKGLPTDMPVLVLDCDRGEPVEICQFSRGTWIEDEDFVYPGGKDWELGEVPFMQDDESGENVVLVTW
jgi:hypothetical protein